MKMSKVKKLHILYLPNALDLTLYMFCLHLNMFILKLPIFGPCLQLSTCKSNHCASSHKVLATSVEITSYKKIRQCKTNSPSPPMQLKTLDFEIVLIPLKDHTFGYNDTLVFFFENIEIIEPKW
jgi:hypothetical protein